MKSGFFAGKCPHAGAANSGVFHWLMQRVTAAALIPLPFWMVFFLKRLVHSSHEQITGWLSAPLNGVFLTFLALVAVYHAVLGMQSIFDDYVHSERYKTVMMWAVKLGLLLMLAAILAAVWRLGAME
jgi:succinate dehydrogenase / fumarate reductase membrane anchor subunit